MRAAMYEAFGAPLVVRTVPDPEPGPGEVVVRVRASGLCRSDWHGWRGHDPDIRSLPHVPGHELAGEIAALGPDVSGWKRGDRVTVPFVAGCGVCEPCSQGDPQVCDAQSQPGFTHWGSFAELVLVRYAENNLVALPGSVGYGSAALLGCRFTTAYRAVVAQGRVAPGEWVVVHGCGGVGLSVVMVASAIGARVVAVDPNPAALQLAAAIGAEVLIPTHLDVVDEIAEATGGGAHVSIDAIGNAKVIASSIASLRKRGRHVQVGLPAGEPPAPIAIDRVVAFELEMRGSHGMAAAAFDPVLGLITSGRVDPSRLITRTCSLDDGAALLPELGRSREAGIVVIDRF